MNAIFSFDLFMVYIQQIYQILHTLNLEKTTPVASHCQTLSHNVVLSTPHHDEKSNSQL
jgi:hypothetical protein